MFRCFKVPFLPLAILILKGGEKNISSDIAPNTDAGLSANMHNLLNHDKQC